MVFWLLWRESNDASSALQALHPTAQAKRRRHIAAISFDLRSCAKTQLQQSLTPLQPFKTWS